MANVAGRLNPGKADGPIHLPGGGIIGKAGDKTLEIPYEEIKQSKSSGKPS